MDLTVRKGRIIKKLVIVFALFLFLPGTGISINYFYSPPQIFGLGVGGKLLFGATGGFYNTWLVNKNVKNDPEIETKFTFAPSYGICVRYNLISFQYNTVHFGYTYELLIAKYSQQYVSAFETNPNSKNAFPPRRTDIFYFDLPLLVRYTIDYAVNAEAGIIISMLRLATGAFALDKDFNQKTYIGERDLKNNFSKFTGGLMLRMSTDIKITKNVAFTPGLKFSYGLLDIISKSGGRGTDYKPDKKTGQPGHPRIYYKGTRLISGGPWVAIIYRF